MIESDKKSDFARRLEAEMERADVPDKKALERLTKITYHRLNPWFVRPTAKPNAADLLTLAKTFNVSEDYLLNGGERKPFRRMAALLARAERLDTELQDELENYLDYLEAKCQSQKSDPERE